MYQNELMDIFEKTGAIMRGHFKFTSGLHSDIYIQCAKVLQHPKPTEKLVEDIVSAFKDDEIDLVIGPAIGGIIVAYETGRQLGIPALFTEREENRMMPRRGFRIPEGARLLVVEDVVTTGGSVREVIDVVVNNGGIVAGVGTLVDRSGGKVDFGVKQKAVITLDSLKTFDPKDCPLCKEGIPLVKPGSRGLQV
jgi:orotate phosphoribosyltransferase